MFLWGSSANSLERVAASRTTPSSPASLLSCHGLRLRSRRTEGWHHVASNFLLRQPWVSYIQHSLYKNQPLIKKPKNGVQGTLGRSVIMFYHVPCAMTFITFITFMPFVTFMSLMASIGLHDFHDNHDIHDTRECHI